MQGNSFLLYAWAWTQAIAIESSGGVVLDYALQSFKEDALQISTSTANKWMLRVRAKQD